MAESPPPLRSRMRAYSLSSSDRSVSPPPRDRDHSQTAEDLTPEQRERQLAEQLRRRVAESRADRSSSSSHRALPEQRSRRSRSTSPARSVGSRRHHSPASRRSHISNADPDEDDTRRSERSDRRYGDGDDHRSRTSYSRRDDDRRSQHSRDESPRHAPRDRYDERPRYVSRDRYPDRRHDRYYDRYDRRDRRDRHPYDRRGPPPRRPRSPSPPPPAVNGDYEERSIFCSQLPARLTQRDLGEFFEEKLGEGSVLDVRIVMDRMSRRSKGLGYVELADRDLLPKALALSGENLYGVPIVVQLTDASRNRGANAEEQYRPNMMGSVDTALGSAATVDSYMSSAERAANANTAARLYVGSLHFELTSQNIKEVFEPFGEIEYVDLHREPGTGKSKGFCFVQYRDPSSAEQALAHMNGMELYGRSIKVGHVNARGADGRSGGDSGSSSSRAPAPGAADGGQQPTALSAFDEGGGGGLNPMTRAALMEKLMRNDSASARQVSAEQHRPANIPQVASRTVLLSNMFNAAEETERDWDKELASDVKEECEDKYGGVARIYVEAESAGDIYVKFVDTSAAAKAVAGLNGRFFGGRSIKAQYIAEAIFNARVG